MAQYCVGIDTGGTYTDAVLINQETGEVVRCLKEPTTHHDLSIGVGRALAGLFTESVRPADVVKLGVSTTLATNSVVEGRGARVGLFVVGYVKHFKLPTTATIFLDGGHNVLGEEEQPLNLEQLVDSVQELAADVDSYAVCAAMSIKNPTHELVAEKAITLLDPKPVFCSHRISVHPGMRERAATAALHAALMPLMEAFLTSVTTSMAQLGLQCPVVLICGNGQAISLEDVVRRAAVTVASGPAASARFGAAAVEGNGLVVDVGGTTTDVCLVRDGRMVMNEQGCRIGDWQTHVEAVDMHTGAAGGDSQVLCRHDGAVSLQAIRVQPLAMTPDLPDPASWLGSDLRAVLVQPVLSQEQALACNDEILRYLAMHGPVTPETLARETKVTGVTLEKNLERLCYHQRIRLSGFTPTDALHVLGRLAIGNGAASQAGAEVLGRVATRSAAEFAQLVIELTEQKIEKIILEYLSRKVWGDHAPTAFLEQSDNEWFTLSCALKTHLVGVGAAARHFLPGVARRLATEVMFPAHYEVGNAMGAALIALQA